MVRRRRKWLEWPLALLMFVLFGFFPPLCGSDERRDPRDNDPREWVSKLDMSRPSYTPLWAPDGSRIVFTARRGLSRNDYSIFVVDADGANLERLSPGDGRYDVDHSPDISPDGARVVYVTSRLPHPVHGWTFDLETSALNGSDRRRLTENGTVEIYPAWSPDGSRVAYMGGSIRTVAPDGTGGREVVSYLESVPGSWHYAGPVWSPDGRRLAFVAKDDHIAANSLYIADADGSQVTRLFTVEAPGHNAPYVAPAWSPDGRLIAFAHFDRAESRMRLYTVSLDGSDLAGRHVARSDAATVSELARGTSPKIMHDVPRSTGSLEWSPDGTAILVAANPGPVYVVAADDSNVRVIGHGSNASWSPDGSRIAISQVDLRLFGAPPPPHLTAPGGALVLLYTVADDGSDIRILVTADGGRPSAGDRIVQECSIGDLTPKSEQASGPMRDCATLLSIKDSLAGGAYLNWSSGTPIVHWEGVTFDTRGSVTELRFRDRLSGVLPPQLGSLAELRVLDLAGNSLTGTIPTELGNLTGLETLNLGGNRLTGTIPPGLGNPTSLVKLHLHYNSLAGAIPPELGNLINLWDLNLSHNDLAGTIPPELGNLINLWALDLSHNSLAGAIPPELGNLVDLVHMQLNSNQLSGCVPAELSSLSTLRTDELDYC